MAYEWILTAATFWVAGCFYALIWHEGEFGKALAWPFDLFNHLTSPDMPPWVWHTITWPLVAVAVARTFNIL